MEYQTASYLTTLLSVRVRDTASSKWSSAEKRTALQSACRVMSSYPIPAVYDGITMAANTYGYALPTRCDQVYAVERRQSSDSLAWEPVPWWEVEPEPITGIPYLWLEFEGSGWGIRVKYVVPLPVPGTSDTTINQTGFTATSTELTLALVAGWPEPGWVKVEDEVIFYTNIDAPAKELQGLVRGVFGAAAAHSTATTVYGVVPAVTDDLHEVLLLLAEAELHIQMLHDSPGAEREEHRWMARWRDQQAKERIKELRRFRPVARARLHPTAKTWQGGGKNDWITPVVG
jgi:hypothetical protein